MQDSAPLWPEPYLVLLAVKTVQDCDLIANTLGIVCVLLNITIKNLEFIIYYTH